MRENDIFKIFPAKKMSEPAKPKFSATDQHIKQHEREARRSQQGEETRYRCHECS